MADDIVYSASLDDSDVIKALDRIDKKIDKTAKDGEKSFNKIGTSAKTSGQNIAQSYQLAAVKIGAAVGAFATLAAAVKEYTDAAIEADVAQTNLNISANAAAREFGTIVGTGQSWKQTLKELRSELQIYSEKELANATTRLIDMSKRLGLTEQQMTEVLRRTAALSAGKVDLQSGIERVTSALRGEAESAEYLGLSLNENSVKVYAESQGLVWKNLSDTEKAQQRYNLLLQRTNEIQDRAAQYANTLAGKEAALNAKLQDQAVTIGEQLLPLREGYAELLDLLTTETEDSASIISKVMAGIAASFIALGAVAIQVTNNLLESFKAIGNGLNNTWEAIKAGKSPLEAIQNDWERFNTAMSAEVTFGDIYNDAFNQILEGWQDQRDAAQQASDDISNLPFKIGGETEITVDTEEVEKALDKLTDLERDAARDRIDIIRKAGQKQVDAEEEAIQKRIDQARKFLQELEDIERKNNQAITDSAKDLSRDEQDARRDFNRKQIDLEKDQVKKRIEIEEDLQEEIRRIQGQYEFDADEAARKGDAVTLLRLQRQRDRQIEEAKITRDQRVKESGQEGEEKRAQLRQELEYELQDAKIADERRLEDLRVRLQRELEEARLKNEREVEELFINEERKRAELKTSLDRQLEESRIANTRRVQDFKESLDAEIAALVEAEQRKIEILKEQIQKRNELDRQTQSLKDRLASEGRTSRLGGRQFGGPVGSGQSVVVGERGPEIFTPSVAGDVIPLGPGIMNALGRPNIANTVNYNQSANVNQSFGAGQDAMTRAIAQNAAMEVIRSVLTR